MRSRKLERLGAGKRGRRETEKKMLDSSRSLDYKAALARRETSRAIKTHWTWMVLVAIVLLAATPSAWAANDPKASGVALPAGSVRVEDNRYRLPDGLETTAKWYSRTYPPSQYPRKLIVNQPGVKAYHVANSNPKEAWTGFNLYEYQGQVRLYILTRDSK